MGKEKIDERSKFVNFMVDKSQKKDSEAKPFTIKEKDAERIEKIMDDINRQIGQGRKKLK